MSSHAPKLIDLGENDYEAGADVDARAEGLRKAAFSVVRYYCATFSVESATLGWTDGYIERGCSLWDVAAGCVIAREAGLRLQMDEVAAGRWSLVAGRWSLVVRGARLRPRPSSLVDRAV